MSVCPQFLCIRPCNCNKDSSKFSPPKATSFGFKEFISNIPENIEVQCLYCHEFKTTDLEQCGTSGFQSTNNIKKTCTEVKSNFHLCIKNIDDFIYIYFQQRCKLAQLDVTSVLEQLEKIHSLNTNKLLAKKNNVFIIILECGQPAKSTSNKAREEENIEELCKQLKEKTQNNSNYCIKISAKFNDYRLTLSKNEEKDKNNRNKYPSGIKITSS